MVNKYLLYLITVVFVFLILFGSRLFCLLTYEKTVGRQIGYEDEYVRTSKGGYVQHYPKISFQTDKGEFIFLAPPYMFEPSQRMESIQVIYEKTDPNKAYAFNFYGFWGPGFLFFCPFFLGWTIVIFSVDFIPRQVNIKKILDTRL